MQAERLRKGGTIGIFCPSHVADMKRYAQTARALERLGFAVKFGKNVCLDSYGYAASAEERAQDLNELVADEEVQMVLFNGGESAVEILPHIDYEAIRRHPKLFCSYSDATSILNTIHARTGLVTYYGPGAGDFADLRLYNYEQFCAHFVQGYEAPKAFVSDSEWKTLHGGCCEGRLIGGYSALFALLLSNRYFRYDGQEKYLLFLEDHEMFSNVGEAATYLGFVEQSAFMERVTGLIFGQYAAEAPEALLRCLQRLGERNNIPVVYTDDFGHGARHAVLPIGRRAKLDADAQSLLFE